MFNRQTVNRNAAACLAASLGLSLGLSLFAATAMAQESTRRIISRTDIEGTNLEMVLMETLLPPGSTSPRHTHPGDEAYYIVDGGTIQMPGKDPVAREPGNAGINKRDVPHAGYTVVGDKTIKMINVYVVDKGKPIQIPAPAQ